jgi:hypothetical protein
MLSQKLFTLKLARDVEWRQSGHRPNADPASHLLRACKPETRLPAKSGGGSSCVVFVRFRCPSSRPGLLSGLPPLGPRPNQCGPLTVS